MPATSMKTRRNRTNCTLWAWQVDTGGLWILHLLWAWLWMKTWSNNGGCHTWRTICSEVSRRMTVVTTISLAQAGGSLSIKMEWFSSIMRITNLTCGTIRPEEFHFKRSTQEPFGISTCRSRAPLAVYESKILLEKNEVRYHQVLQILWHVSEDEIIKLH